VSAPPLAGAPDPAQVIVPDAVRRIAAGRPLRAVWLNGAGGLTFEILGASPTFVKYAPTASGLDLGREAERLAWASRFTPVPSVIDLGADAGGAWLQTAAVPGDNAVGDRWKADPGPAVAAIGHGLRALHDALPAADCPFDWSLETRLTAIRARAAAGLIDPSRWRAEFRDLSLAEALGRVEAPPPIDHLVVCHGDACAPNTLVGAAGRWSGHIDLGDLGLADRWADLAVASWSLDWNFGPGWDAAFYAAYGVAPDLVRIAYYRLLWTLEG
jgi:kanamycin kinase